MSIATETDEDAQIREDEIDSIRIAIRSRYSQIRDLNKKLIELGSEPEDE